MDKPLTGGHRSRLLYWQRLVLLTQARDIVSRFTILQEQAIVDGLPGSYIFKIERIRGKAVLRQMRRAEDLATYRTTARPRGPLKVRGK